MIMRLLVITQKVDVNDDIFGFFHRWIEKFAENLDFVNVICLQKGEYSLPQNVKVFSLGKERRHSRIEEVCRFYQDIWRLRNDYDTVFVHMNAIYVVLSGCLWKIWGKKIYFWHNHRHGNLITRIAILWADTVFYTSPFSFSAKFKKSKIMPAGIDTDIFQRDAQIQKIPRSILYAGRFSPVKNVDVLIKAADLLDKRGLDFVLNIVGQPGDDEQDNFQKIKTSARDLEVRGKIKFLGKAQNSRLPEIYGQNDVVINLTQAGSFDKTILEAMACQNIVLVSNPAFENIFPEEYRRFLIFKERDAQDLAKKIVYLMNLPENEKIVLGQKLRAIAVRDHNLDNLIAKIIHESDQK